MIHPALECFGVKEIVIRPPVSVHQNANPMFKGRFSRSKHYKKVRTSVRKGYRR